MSARRPLLLGFLTRLLIRGPHAIDIRRDLDEIYHRDRRHGVGALRARARYLRNSLASAAHAVRHLRPRVPSVAWLDFVVGARLMGRDPGLTLIAGLGIAVTIAIGVASFTFFYATLYPRLPLDEVDRLVGLENWDIERSNEARRQFHDYVAWRDNLDSISEIGAFRPVGADIVGGIAVERVRVAQMTASAFRIARVAPLMGRLLDEGDERDGAAHVLVIGHSAWLSRFGGDPEVVGREVRLGRTPHTIVGVMPEGFGFPYSENYWTPLRVDPSAYGRGAGPAIYIFGRLAPGATFEQSQEELAALGRRAAAAFPESHANLRPRVYPFTYPLIDIQEMSFAYVGVFQLVVALLLAVVGVNVAVLTYARNAARAGELAVRSALGASRRRLLTQFIVEAFVLSSAAAVVGVVMAKFLVREAHRVLELDFSNSPPFWADYSLPPAAWLYTLGMVMAMSIIAGGLPAMRATRADLRGDLGRIGGAVSTRFGRTWTLLIVAQVAITVAGLPASLSMGWTVLGSVATRPTFVADELISTRVSMQMDFPPRPDEESERIYAGPYRASVARLEQAFEAEADVSHVTIAARVPGYEPTRQVEIERLAPGTESTQPAATRTTAVGIDFFEALDAPLRDGRGFSSADLGDNARAVIVNETFVRRLFDGVSPLGHRFRYVERQGDSEAPRVWHEIIGVVADLHVNESDPDWVRPTVYHPLDVADVGHPAQLIIRVPGSSVSSGLGDIVARLDEITAATDPTLRLVESRAVDRLSEQESVAVRTALVVLTLVVSSVLLLSAAGIHALMAFTVTRRRHEIGIRVALGGRPAVVLRDVSALALWQLGAGVAVGALTAALLDAFAGGDFLGDKAFALVPATSLILLLIGSASAWVPARRGLNVQPSEALRAE